MRMARDKEKQKAWWKVYYEAHKDEVKMRSKSYYEAHKDEHAARSKAYRESHKDEYKAQKKAWYEAHKDEHKAWCKAHYEAQSKLMYIWADEKKSKWKHEGLCRRYFEYLFNKPFRCRFPDFLKTEDVSRLQLDGYCEELRLAFEYNGKQHYEYVPYYHKDMMDVFNAADNDREKARLCNEHDITLIVIPYKIKAKALFNYIMTECERLGFADKFALEWI